MRDPKIARIITANGEELRTTDLTDDEKERVKDAWDSGTRDPVELRDLVDQS